jgi:hypothetical protein
LTLVPVSFSNEGMSARDELPFTWSSDFERLEETVARVADFLTAKAAYEALVKRRPGEAIMVRQGARVVLKSC